MITKFAYGIARLPLYDEPPDSYDVIEALAYLLSDNAVLLMAQASIWLDPTELTEEDEYSDDALRGLRIVRDIFPDLYPLAVEFHRQNPDETAASINSLLMDEMPPELKQHEAENEMMDEEIMSFIPLAPVGFQGFDGDEEETDETILEVVDAVGNDIDDKLSQATAEFIWNSLHDSGDDVLENVGWFVAWLYGVSGNTMFDLAYWQFVDGGYDLPLWSEFDYIYSMQEEAFECHEKAMAGWRALERDPQLMDCLRSNAKKVRALKRRKPDGSTKLEWIPYAGNRDDCRSRTQRYLDVLPFRRLPEEREHGISG